MTDARNRNLNTPAAGLRGVLARLRIGSSTATSQRTALPRCVLEVSEHGARAIEADASGGIVSLRRAWDSRSSVDGSQQFLREPALQSGLMLCISRSDAMLRTIALPTDNAEEIRDMARLAVLRDLPVEGVAGVSDYLVLDSTHGASTIVGTALSTVRFGTLCALCPSAPVAASVRTLGTLELLRTHATARDECVLAIDCLAERVEFLLLKNGAPTFSRAADISGDASARGARVLMETRRALLALRSGEDGVVLQSVWLLSDAGLAREILPELEHAVGCSAKRLDSHPLLRLPATAEGETARASCLPLLGLLLARLSARHSVDFMRPAQPVDRAARTRRRVFVALGVTIFSALCGWAGGSFSYRSIQIRADQLRERATTVLPDLQRAKREEFRLKHIALWLESSPAWLDYLAEFRNFAPETSVVVLDGLSGVLNAGEIAFNRDRWEVTGRELKFTLDGEAKNRATADALRDALVAAKSLGVTSTGADARGGRRLPYPFTYVIRTADLQPSKPNPSPTAPRIGGGS